MIGSRSATARAAKAAVWLQVAYAGLLLAAAPAGAWSVTASAAIRPVIATADPRPFIATAENHTSGTRGEAGHRALHLRLESSEPADGDTLAVAPERIRLEFSQAVSPRTSQVALLGVDGETGLALSTGESAEILLAAAPLLAAGRFTVRWRVMAADGHPVTGTFTFYIANGRRTAVPEDSGEAGAGAGVDDPAGADSEANLRLQSPDEGGEGPAFLLALLRGLGIGSLMAVAGLLVFLVWITPSAADRVWRLTQVVAVIAPLLLALHLFAWLRTTAPPGGLDLGWVGTMIGSTGAGRAESVRLACAVIVIFALRSHHPGLAATLALTGVAVSGVIGHALAIEPMLSVPAKSAHLVGAALWFGGLLILATDRRDRDGFAASARRVSAVALTSVIAIAFTGIVQAVILIDPAELVTSSYGRLVLAKAGGLLVLVGFGARNRRRLLPRLDEEGGPARLQRSVGMESWVMIGVILLAGYLSYVPLPEG